MTTPARYFHAHPPMCGATREGRQCDLIRHYGGLHMWLNARPPLVVSWGYVNSDDTNPSGVKP